MARARAARFRNQTTAYRPSRTEKVESIDPGEVEELFLRHLAPGAVTTLRSADYLNWRFLAAPYRSELAFYLTRVRGALSQCAVVRYLPAEPRQGRILDVIGDHADEEGLTDLIRTILHDAMRQEVERVGVLGSSPGLRSSLECAGFTPHYLKRFRWRSTDGAVHDRLSSVQLHWSLADSDADRPQ